MILQPTCQTAIDPYISKFIPVTLSQEKELTIANFLKKSSDTYLKNNNLDKHVNIQPWKLMKMVLSGEAALEQFLDINIINYSLNKYYQYESKGLNNGNVRIKVFKYGSFPTIYKQSAKDVIFVMQRDTHNFYICGYASKKVLNSYQTVHLVPPNEYNREKKACFYGFDELRPFTDTQVLKAVFG